MLETVLLAEGESPTLKAITCRASKPGLTSHKWRMVRNSRPAPTNKTKVSAICTITRLLCARRCGLVEPRPPAFSAACRSVCELCSAGARPNRIPTTTETPSANKSTERFTPMFSLRGKLPGSAASTGRTPHFANRRPSVPPASESSTLSVTNCRTMRALLAPSAERQQKRSAHVRDEFVLEGLKVRSQTAIGGRVELIQLRLNRAHFRFGLRDGGAGFQARNAEDRMDRTIAVDQWIALSDRRVNIRIVSEQAKIRGQHAGNRVVHSVQSYGFAQGLAAASETIFP